MQDLLAFYPGAQRALFRKYHVGGCSSCGFAPTETLAQICARNPHMDLPEVTAFLQTAPCRSPLNSTALHEQTAPFTCSMHDFDAVHIPGSNFHAGPA